MGGENLTERWVFWIWNIQQSRLKRVVFIIIRLTLLILGYHFRSRGKEEIGWSHYFGFAEFDHKTIASFEDGYQERPDQCFTIMDRYVIHHYCMRHLVHNAYNGDCCIWKIIYYSRIFVYKWLEHLDLDLKGVSSLTSLHYLWRSLGLFSLPYAQKWSIIIIIITTNNNWMDLIWLYRCENAWLSHWNCVDNNKGKKTLKYTSKELVIASHVTFDIKIFHCFTNIVMVGWGFLCFGKLMVYWSFVCFQSFMR